MKTAVEVSPAPDVPYVSRRQRRRKIASFVIWNTLVVFVSVGVFLITPGDERFRSLIGALPAFAAAVLSIYSSRDGKPKK